MKSRKKTLEEEKPKSNNCDCSPEEWKPKGGICVGVYGYFQHCSNCSRERRVKIKYYEDGQMRVI